MKASSLTARLLAALLLLGGGACSRKEEIVVFATARTQGRLWARPEPAFKNAPAGGFAVFKKLYDAETRPKLALDDGGWYSATPEGWLTRGRSTMDCLAGVPYAAAAPGMEELALSPRELEDLAKASAVPLLASNLYLKTNRKPGFLRSQELLRVGGRKIGVFALVVPSADKPNRARYLANYKLEKPSYETEKAVKALHDGGAEVIIMLLSVGAKEKTAQPFYKELLSRGPRVDLVVTDDPSVKKPFRAGRSWVVPAGQEALYASRAVLRLDPATGRLKDVDWDRLPLLAEKYGQDQGMLKIITAHRRTAAAHMSKPVGRLDEALPLAAGAESPLADFAADCMRRWTRSDAALISLSEPAAGLSSGTVTVGDLRAAFPLDSNVVFVKIRGDDLERALAAVPLSGISVSGLKLFLKDGAFERAEEDGAPLRPARVYRLAVPDSFVGGRDTPVLSSAMEFANSRRQLRDIMGWCFSRQRSIPRPAGDRIVRN